MDVGLYLGVVRQIVVQGGGYCYVVLYGLVFVLLLDGDFGRVFFESCNQYFLVVVDGKFGDFWVGCGYFGDWCGEIQYFLVVGCYVYGFVYGGGLIVGKQCQYQQQLCFQVEVLFIVYRCFLILCF